MATQPDDREASMDPASLYREDVYTDRKIGTIRRLTPVRGDGENDATRPVLYVGETQVMSSVGALPIVFEIEATSVEDAASKFGGLAKTAIERTMRELQELRRQAASSIVIPQAGGMGGAGGGGKIQLP